MRIDSAMVRVLLVATVCACWPFVARAQAPVEVTLAAGTPASAESIVDRYAALPKGVVLEGTAEGMEAVRTVGYDKEKNEFLINGTIKYANPVSRKDFVRIVKALRKDDRMGMTLLEGQPRVYGPLSSDSEIVKQMVETDKLLGGIIYGLDFLLEGVKLPGGYKPKHAAARAIPVVAFTRFANYAFGKAGEYYRLSSCNIDVQLIPLAEKKTESGGHLPDTEKMKEYVMEPTDQENIAHLHAHQAEYLRIPAFAKTAAAGEAASVARLFRDAKVDLDVLLKLMD
jgi:hypothetical protein